MKKQIIITLAIVMFCTIALATDQEDLRYVVATHDKLIYEQQYLELQIKVCQERLRIIKPQIERLSAEARELSEKIRAEKLEQDTKAQDVKE